MRRYVEKVGVSILANSQREAEWPAEDKGEAAFASDCIKSTDEETRSYPSDTAEDTPAFTMMWFPCCPLRL